MVAYKTFKRKRSDLPDPLKKKRSKKEKKESGLSFMHRAAFEIEFDKKARGTPSSLSTLSHRLSARLNEPI
jgi:hypothetical protein